MFNNYKKIVNSIAFILLLILASLFITSCENSELKTFNASKATTSIAKGMDKLATKKIAVAYFSITGNTEKVAHTIDLFIYLKNNDIIPQYFKDTEYYIFSMMSKKYLEQNTNLLS